MNHELYNKALKVWQGGPSLKDEYHSSTGFLSNSFIGDFLKCEYGAMIDYSHVIKKPESFNEAFAVGHLTEAICFEGEEGEQKMLERYEQYAFDRSKKPKAWVRNSREYAKSITRHDNIKKLLQAEGSKYHQTLIFKLHGVDWRGEVDYLNLNKLTEIDMKTTKSSFYEKSWRNVDGKNVKDSTFIDDWNYHRQRAIYQYGINELYEVQVLSRILAVSKKNKSVKLFKFDDQERLDYEVKNLIPTVNRFKTLRDGESEPTMCKECVHCVEAEKVETEISVSTYCAELYI